MRARRWLFGAVMVILPIVIAVNIPPLQAQVSLGEGMFVYATTQKTYFNIPRWKCYKIVKAQSDALMSYCKTFDDGWGAYVCDMKKSDQDEKIYVFKKLSDCSGFDKYMNYD